MCAFHKLLRSVLIVLASLLAGCGGGSSGGDTTAGIGGTGQIASGTITGFGSIFVNGIEFDINAANCSIDDINSTGNCQANLQLGMVVAVTGTINGTTGNATQVIYDDDVDGPVTGISTLNAGDITRTFRVFGTTILIDSATTTFTGGKDFSSLQDGDLVEVSGFFDNNGVLHATYVEYKGTLALGSTTVEIKGTVSATTPASGAASSGDTFDVNGVTVTIMAGTDLSDMPGGVVSTGSLIEVRGTLQTVTTVDADRVEPEDNNVGGDGDEVSIEGLITNFVSQSNFRVDGQLVDASSATLNPGTLQLGNGVKVEVEGTISGSTLTANEVEARGNDIKIEATVSAVSSNSVSVGIGNGTLTIQVDNQTQMEDKTGAVTNMMLSDINVAAGDFLEIRGFVGAGGTIVASELRRESAANAGADILQGPVDNWNAGTDVTVLGITFVSNGSTSFEDETETGITSTDFYNALSVGRVVKIRDDVTPDGIANEMDLEN